MTSQPPPNPANWNNPNENNNYQPGENPRRFGPDYSMSGGRPPRAYHNVRRPYNQRSYPNSRNGNPPPNAAFDEQSGPSGEQLSTACGCGDEPPTQNRRGRGKSGRGRPPFYGRRGNRSPFQHGRGNGPVQNEQARSYCVEGRPPPTQNDQLSTQNGVGDQTQTQFLTQNELENQPATENVTITQPTTQNQLGDEPPIQNERGDQPSMENEQGNQSLRQNQPLPQIIQDVQPLTENRPENQPPTQYQLVGQPPKKNGRRNQPAMQKVKGDPPPPSKFEPTFLQGFSVSCSGCFASNKASAKCYECNFYFCEKCAEHHTKNRQTRFHHIYHFGSLAERLSPNVSHPSNNQDFDCPASADGSQNEEAAASLDQSQFQTDSAPANNYASSRVVGAGRQQCRDTRRCASFPGDQDSNDVLATQAAINALSMCTSDPGGLIFQTGTPISPPVTLGSISSLAALMGQLPINAPPPNQANDSLGPNTNMISQLLMSLTFVGDVTPLGSPSQPLVGNDISLGHDPHQHANLQSTIHSGSTENAFIPDLSLITSYSSSLHSSPRLNCAYQLPPNSSPSSVAGYTSPQIPSPSSAGGYSSPQNPSLSSVGGYASPQNSSLSSVGGYASPQNPSPSSVGGYASPQNPSPPSVGGYHSLPNPVSSWVGYYNSQSILDEAAGFVNQVDSNLGNPFPTHYPIPRCRYRHADGKFFCVNCISPIFNPMLYSVACAIPPVAKLSLELCEQIHILDLRIRRGLDNMQRMNLRINRTAGKVVIDIKCSFSRFKSAFEEREDYLLQRTGQIRGVKLNLIKVQMDKIRWHYAELSRVFNLIKDPSRFKNPQENMAANHQAYLVIRKARNLGKAIRPCEDDDFKFVQLSTGGYIADIGEVVVSPSPLSNAAQLCEEPRLYFCVPFPMNPLPRSIGRAIFNCEKIIQVKNYGHRIMTMWGGSGPKNGQLCRPWGITMNRFGHIIVSDRCNSRIQIFDSDGNFLHQFGSHGTGKGQFNRPSSVAINSQDDFIVADKDNHRIQVFSKSCEFLLTFGEKGTNVGQFFFPWDVACDSFGNILVSDVRNHRIQMFRWNGVFINQWKGGKVAVDKPFCTPRGVAFDPQGNILLTDFNAHCVVQINRITGASKTIGGHGRAPGYFNRPQGICCDDRGWFVVADSRNYRYQVFNEFGEFKWMWGREGKTYPGELDRPSAVTIDPYGHIYVMDYGNDRVQVI